jgi:hypothetical protein
MEMPCIYKLNIKIKMNFKKKLLKLKKDLFFKNYKISFKNFSFYTVDFFLS